jgi:hypothetical protein
MSFTRTNSGLSNLALFHGVDLIVFTEGGENSYSYEDVLTGKFNERSVDIKFWSGIFSKHNFGKTVEFRALGSKTCSKAICELLVSNTINNIVVALDSDLDDITGTKFISPYILYTRGYSWENDVYHPQLVKEQIESLVYLPKLPSNYTNIINESYRQFDRFANRILKLELIFRDIGSKFITDCSGERFINGKTKPELKIDQIKTLLKQRKDILVKPVNLQGVGAGYCGIKYCYGKLREALAIANISYIVGNLEKQKSLPKNIIVTSMLDRYQRRINHTEDDYYSNIISDLVAA